MEGEKEETRGEQWNLFSKILMGILCNIFLKPFLVKSSNTLGTLFHNVTPNLENEDFLISSLDCIM